jgi:hypothetical protein
VECSINRKISYFQEGKNQVKSLSIQFQAASLSREDQKEIERRRTF